MRFEFCLLRSIRCAKIIKAGKYMKKNVISDVNRRLRPGGTALRDSAEAAIDYTRICPFRNFCMN